MDISEMAFAMSKWGEDKTVFTVLSSPRSSSYACIHDVYNDLVYTVFYQVKGWALVG